ncbi:hypothetical protein X777_01741, partial [Ooceraea biroi]
SACPTGVFGQRFSATRFLGVKSKRKTGESKFGLGLGCVFEDGDGTCATTEPFPSDNTFPPPPPLLLTPPPPSFIFSQ